MRRLNDVDNLARTGVINNPNATFLGPDAPPGAAPRRAFAFNYTEYTARTNIAKLHQEEKRQLFDKMFKDDGTLAKNWSNSTRDLVLQVLQIKLRGKTKYDALDRNTRVKKDEYNQRISFIDTKDKYQNLL
jgi:hypothetical protein